MPDEYLLVETEIGLKESLEEVTAHLAAGRRAEAHTGAELLVSKYPRAARAHNIRGIVRGSSNNGEGALTSFRLAIELDPSLGEAHYNMGLVLCRQLEFSLAVESLYRAIGLDSGVAAYQIVLGNALRELGRHNDAREAYERALSIGGVPESLIANNLGAVYLDLNIPDRAIQFFKRSVQLNPNAGEPHQNLAKALRQAGQLREAMESCRRALKIDPISERAASLLANTLRDLGRLEEAVDAYRVVLKLQSHDKQAAYHLGLTLLDLGRVAEGLKIIADGPGVVRVTASSDGCTDDLAPRAVAISGGASPNFIGAWEMPDPAICDRVISFFKANAARSAAGKTGSGIDRQAKDSSDLTVLPCDLEKPEYGAIAEYISHLEKCYQDYCTQWPFLGATLRTGEIMPFTIQHYGPGGHFQRVHSERGSISFAHRVLAWMTYLDDVEEGGETHFPHFGIFVRPERGKTLIWPAEWTHAHAGTVVRKGHKHIITGWIHFPLHRV